jgi:protein TonB
MPAKSNEAPAIRLGDNGEIGTGLVSGAAVIPAGLNATVQNRLPAYPSEAARRGEEGVVVLLVQIALDGSATAVDVAESSGYELLDQSARAAVSRWRFRAAVRVGAPIASAMEVDVHFAIRRKTP